MLVFKLMVKGDGDADTTVMSCKPQPLIAAPARITRGEMLIIEQIRMRVGRLGMEQGDWGCGRESVEDAAGRLGEYEA
jgi:hypothetical protein